MNVMMILGNFPFMIDTAPYEQLKRAAEYKWAQQDRLGHPILKWLGIGGPAMQYMGPGSQSVTINGSIYPGQQGMKASVALLRVMAGLGLPIPLVTFSGAILGLWIIKQVEETQSSFAKSGIFIGAKKIEFSLTLERYLGSDIDDARLAATL